MARTSLTRAQIVLQRDLRRGLRRILNPPKSPPMSDQGVRWLLEKTKREVEHIAEGEYAVALLQREVERRQGT